MADVVTSVGHSPHQRWPRGRHWIFLPGLDTYFLAKVLGKMSAPQRGGEFSRVPPVNAKPQRMAPVGFNPGPGMGMVRRGMNTRNNALALGLGVAAAGVYVYTMYAFSQDVLLNEVETEAEIMRAQAAKTSSD